MDYELITDIEFEGIDWTDYPDFCDAFISRALYNGREMTENELSLINEDFDYVYEQLIKSIF